MVAAIPAGLGMKYVRSLQMALNEKTHSNLPTTGRFNAEWVAVLKKFQVEHRLVSTGQYDDETQALLHAHIEYKYLNDNDYVEAAEILGCSVAAIKAVVRTCIVGSGFISSGKCRIAFSRDRFHQALTKLRSPAELQALQREHPMVVNTMPGGFLRDDYEYVRFCQAVAIDSIAAMQSTTWGMFQLPGTLYRSCGYDRITAFAVDMQLSERHQLHAFVRHIKNTPALLTAIRSSFWTVFANLYFGKANDTQHYDKRIADSYRDHVKASTVKEKA